MLNLVGGRQQCSGELAGLFNGHVVVVDRDDALDPAVCVLGAVDQHVSIPVAVGPLDDP
jgi:hypothetical protein